MNHQDYKTTREWQALNHIWKSSSKEVQQSCFEDFITPASKYFFSNLKNVNLPE